MAKVTFPEALHDHYKPGGDRCVYHTEGPTLTRQEFADECDINSIMARYEGHVIGGPGNLAPQEPRYFDYAAAPQTLLEFLTFMQEADAQFMSLPAQVRREFDNDPKLFVDFASDPENLDQMRTWGLAPPAKPPEPAKPAEPATASPGAGGAPAAAPAASTHGST